VNESSIDYTAEDDTSLVKQQKVGLFTKRNACCRQSCLSDCWC